MCLLVVSGCSLVQQTARLPAKTVNAVSGKQTQQQLDPAAVQEKVLSYADDFMGRTTAAIDDYARIANTPEARSQAMAWKLTVNSAVLGIATGANPTANLVDFLALSSLSRAFLEKRAPVEPPHAFDMWLENSRLLETNAWKLADEILTKDQQAEFRAAVKQWLAENAGESGFLRRPQELASGIRQEREKESGSGSVFSLVGLDPTAGLDPAVREVTRTRLFAERALFAAQRMPFLIRWQTELLTTQLLQQEQITNTVSSVERLSRAAETASQTAALLPDRISTERKAVLDALEAQEGKLRDLTAQVGQSLTAGEKMSTSLNTTLITFDALMKRFGVGEAPATPPDTNSPPFNISDYGHAAEQVATMAQQLNALIKDASGTMDAPALDKRIAQLNELTGQARAEAKSVLNHAFLLMAGLLVLGFACAFVYRHFGPGGARASVEPRSQETNLKI
jgi:hypothetical protein